MKNRIIYTISVGALCAAVTGGICFTVANKSDKTTVLSNDINTSVNDILKITNTGDTTFKDETVFVITDAYGVPSKTIVSDHIQNGKGLDTISDYSNLMNIEDTKGNLEFNDNKWEANGSDVYYQGTTDQDLPVDVHISYALDGKPITPEQLAGRSGKVKMTFSYTNNQKMRINGYDVYVPFICMSGLLLDQEVFSNIEIDHGKVINNGEKQVVMGYGIPGLADSLNVKTNDINISEGFTVTADVNDFKLLTSITFISNSLFNDIDFDDVNDLNDLKNKLNKLSTSSDQLVEGTNELYKGMSTLLEKSGTLTDGVEQLSNGGHALVSGIKQLETGINQLKNGTNQLSTGLGQLAKNNNTLNNGASKIFDAVIASAQTQIQSSLDSNDLELTIPTLTQKNYKTELDKLAKKTASANGNENIYDALLAMVTKQANMTSPTNEGISNAKEQVTAVVKQNVENQVSNSIDEGRNQVAEVVSKGIADAKAEALASVKKQAAINYLVQTKNITAEQAATILTEDIINQVYAQGKTTIDATADQYALAGINQKYGTSFTSFDEANTTLTEVNLLAQLNTKYNQNWLTVTDANNALVETNMASDQVKQIIISNTIDAVMASDTIKNQLDASTNAILAAKSQLNEVNTFVDGLATYTAGVKTAYEGSKALVNGTNQLSIGISGKNGLLNGSKSLSDGIDTLKKGTGSLIEGVTKLFKGSEKLNKGMNQFDQEGINKLMSIYHNDVEGLINRVKAISKASKAYNNFSGIDSSMEGAVKFIYRTDSIEK